MCLFREHKKHSLIFGFIRLHNEEDTMLLESLMKEYFLNGSIGDLSVSHGMIAMVGLTDLKGVHPDCRFLLLAEGGGAQLRHSHLNTVLAGALALRAGG